MKLKKSTRKQLLRFVAMVLFVAMIISSTAPIYAIHNAADADGTDAEVSAEDFGGEDIIIPATRPELVENSTVNPTEEPTPDHEQSSVQDGGVPSDGANTASGSKAGGSTTPEDAAGAESDEKTTVSSDTELSERIISSTASDNAVVEINGLLPEGATVSVHPTEVDLYGQNVLAAYDITILDKDGQEYKFTDSGTVTISGISALQKLTAKNVNVYHMENENAKAELVSNVSVNGDSVTFTANSFSVYAVTVDAANDISLYASEGSEVDEDESNNSYSYISINDPENKVDWTVTITKAKDNAFESEGKYSRETEFTFKLTYKFDNTIHPDANTGAYFELPESLQFTDKIHGDIIERVTGRIIGYYDYVQDDDGNGKIYFVFDEEWLPTNKSNIEGDFEFTAKVSSSASENKSDVNVQFPGKSEDLTIHFEDGKVNGYKNGKLTEDGTQIEYTVTLTVANKDVTNVTLTDILGDGLTFVEGSFTLVDKQTGKNITLTDVSLTNSEKQCDIKIDELKIGTYELTYRVYVDHDVVGEKAKNQVTWTWDGYKEGDNNKASKDVSILKHGVQKEGWLEGNRIAWKITVKPDQLESVVGTIITDTLGDGMKYEGTFNIYKADEWGQYDSNEPVVSGNIEENESGGFTYTFENTSEYTYENGTIYCFVYYTTIDDLDKPGPYTNSVESGGEKVEANVPYTPPTPSEPSLEEDIVEKTGELVSDSKKILWTIEINPDNYKGEGEITGLVLKDTIPNSGFNGFIYDTNSLTVAYEDGEKVGNYKVSWSPDTENATSFMITFDKEFKLTKTIIVSYITEPKGNYSGRISNQIETTYEIDGIPGKENDSSTVEFKTDTQFSKTGEINGLEVEWTILANWEGLDTGQQWGKCGLQGEYTIRDTLPSGMEYEPGSVTYAVSSNIFSDAELKFHNAQEIVPGISFDDYSNDKNLFFRLDIHDGDSTNGRFIVLKYKTKITDVNAGVPVGESSYSFTNSAEFDGKDSWGERDISGRTSGTVTYTKQVLDKYGALSSEYINSIDYTILVNCDEDDLLKDSDFLTLVDTLDPNTTLALDSLMVTDYKTGENITDLCQLSYDSSGKRGKFILTVPDERALLVTYRVKVSGDTGEEINITNTATLEGDDSNEDTSEISVTIQSSKAGATGESADIIIQKIDQDNVFTSLPPAEFTLYKWNGEDFTEVITKETNDDGKILFGVLPSVDHPGEGALYTDTLYYYVETKAPEGYILDPTPHYFILKGSSFDEHELKEFEAKFGEIACYDGVERDQYGNIVRDPITVLVSNKKEKVPAFSFFVEKTDEVGNKFDGAVFLLTGGPDGISKELTVGDVAAGGKFGEIEFKELKPGIYTLKEVSAPAGYIMTGPKSYTITIENNGTITCVDDKGNPVSLNERTLTVKNTRTTGNVSFSVKKNFDGWDKEPWQDGEFGFEFELSAINGAPMPADGTTVFITNEDSESFTKAFGSITFTEAGTYYYTIIETSKENNSIDYDDTVYYVKVVVSDKAGETTKTVQVYTSTDGVNSDNWTGPINDDASTAEFENSLKLGKLTIFKEIHGLVLEGKTAQEIRELIASLGIEFVVTGPYGYSKTITAEELTIEGTSIEAVIDDLPYGEYTVTESYGDKDGYTITTSHVVGSDNEPGKSVKITLSSDEQQVKFINTYRRLGELVVEKTFDGDKDALTDQEKRNIQFIVRNDKKEVLAFGDDGKYIGPAQGDDPISFTYAKMKGEGNKKTFTLTDLPDGTYYVEERIGSAEKDGYALKVTYTVSSNEGTLEENSISVTFPTEGQSEKIEVTNTYSALTDIPVEKVWLDDGSIRPDSIEVTLKKKDGKVLAETNLDAEHNWTGKFADLPKHDGQGHLIQYDDTNEYTVVEKLPDEVAGAYESDVVIEAVGESYSIKVTNRQLIDIPIMKIWDDNRNPNRPESITVRLVVVSIGGTESEQLEPTELAELRDLRKEISLSKDNALLENGDKWEYVFEKLPAYCKHNKKIEYKVEEVVPDGYDVEYNGYNMTNKQKPTATATPTTTPNDTVTATATPTTTPNDTVTATATPTTTPNDTVTATATPTTAPNDTVTATATPGVVPTPSNAPVLTKTPAPETPPESENSDDGPGDSENKPNSTPEPVATPEPLMEEPQVLRARRYQMSGAEGMVLGARRGMDYAVLGMRRRPSTGDSVVMLWWLLSLFTTLGGFITSGIMIIFDRKKK